MKTLSFFAAGVAVVAATSFSVALEGPKSERIIRRHPGLSTPVLVELFTSEGCSSCPPADKLLAQLQKEQPADGALIIPLSEHVDYWNSDQWRDQFSSSAFSARQNEYVKSLKVDSPYTPQMVVDGRAELVGSDEDSALKSISEASKTPKTAIDLTATAIDQSDLEIGVGIKNTLGLTRNGLSDVFVAITENNLTSRVRGGENSGRQLWHTAVVRVLQRVGTIRDIAPYVYKEKIPLGSNWKKKDLSVVAFIQAREGRQVLGAAITEPTMAQ